jgi:hypothetical protein
LLVVPHLVTHLESKDGVSKARRARVGCEWRVCGYGYAFWTYFVVYFKA